MVYGEHPCKVIVKKISYRILILLLLVLSAEDMEGTLQYHCNVSFFFHIYLVHIILIPLSSFYHSRACSLLASSFIKFRINFIPMNTHFYNIQFLFNLFIFCVFFGVGFFFLHFPLFLG